MHHVRHNQYLPSLCEHIIWQFAHKQGNAANQTLRALGMTACRNLQNVFHTNSPAPKKGWWKPRNGPVDCIPFVWLARIHFKYQPNTCIQTLLILKRGCLSCTCMCKHCDFLENFSPHVNHSSSCTVTLTVSGNTSLFTTQYPECSS